jgi:predicted PurR-regulated permease PerM
MARPLFLWLQPRLRGSPRLASLATLLAVAVVVLIPLSLLVAVVVGQALDVTQTFVPWLKERLADPDAFLEGMRRLPFYENLLPLRSLLIERLGEAATIASKFVVGGLSSLTVGTLNFFFMAFVMLYSMYFLQIDGHKLVSKILYYLPLKSADERVMLQKFTSVTRATLKGTLLIGLLQGGLAGVAFAIAGIENAVFWGTVMVVLSIIPAVGSALVWVPACIVLAVQGHMGSAIGLALFCALVVGSLDNVLRPILVGRDTKMHELMIFLSTLGGIFMFGFNGLFIGPLIASLFISIWEVYGVELADLLPDVESVLDDLDKVAEAPDPKQVADAVVRPPDDPDPKAPSLDQTPG